MYCTQDCTCSLCRELRGFNFKPAIVCNQSKGPVNDNFILRRRLSDIDNDKAPVRIVESVNKKTLTKSKSYNELWKRFDPRNMSKKKVKDSKIGSKECSKKVDGHKVIIYFGDSIPHKRQPLTPYKTDGDDFEHARRLCKEIDDKKTGKNLTKVMITKDEITKKKSDDHTVKTKSEVDVMKQLKTVLNKKNNPTNHVENSTPIIKTVVELPPEPTKYRDKSVETKNGDDLSLPSYIESVVNGVINVKVENNFQHASELVNSISKGPIVIGSDGNENEDHFDWSFVQEWRTR